MNRTATTLALAAGISCAAFGYEPQRHNDTFTTNGITYAQRGGLGASDYVVTNIDASAVGKVQSVNGKTGDVELTSYDADGFTEWHPYPNEEVAGYEIVSCVWTNGAWQVKVREFATGDIWSGTDPSPKDALMLTVFSELNSLVRERKPVQNILDSVYGDIDYSTNNTELVETIGVATETCARHDEDGKLQATAYRIPWGYAGYIEFSGDTIHFYHPPMHGSSGTDKTLTLGPAAGNVALESAVAAATNSLYYLSGQLAAQLSAAAAAPKLDKSGGTMTGGVSFVNKAYPLCLNALPAEYEAGLDGMPFLRSLIDNAFIGWFPGHGSYLAFAQYDLNGWLEIGWSNGNIERSILFGDTETDGALALTYFNGEDTQIYRFSPYGGDIAMHHTIAKDFSAAQSYQAGDIVYRNGFLYRAIVPHHGTWNANNFEVTNVANALKIVEQEAATAGAALTNYATKTWVEDKNYLTASDIPTSMAWGAITSKPTTLSGYGITDALKADFSTLTNNAAFTSAVAAVSPPVDLSGYCTTGEAAGIASNVVSQAYIRQKLGVYLYVGEDGGIYVHTNEE